MRGVCHLHGAAQIRRDLASDVSIILGVPRFSPYRTLVRALLTPGFWLLTPSFPARPFRYRLALAISVCQASPLNRSSP